MHVGSYIKSRQAKGETLISRSDSSFTKDPRNLIKQTSERRAITAKLWWHRVEVETRALNDRKKQRIVFWLHFMSQLNFLPFFHLSLSRSHAIAFGSPQDRTSTTMKLLLGPKESHRDEFIEETPIVGAFYVSLALWKRDRLKICLRRLLFFSPASTKSDENNFGLSASIVRPHDLGGCQSRKVFLA